MPLDGEALPLHVQTKIKALDALKKARDLLSDPRRWVKQRLASTRGGETSYPGLKSAYSFCMVGSVHHVADDDDARARALKALRATLKRRSIEDFNDATCRTHNQVLAKFDAAIANVEKEIAEG